MQILTEREEFIAPDLAAETKQSRAFADPFPLNAFVFGVVIPNAEMLLEVAWDTSRSAQSCSNPGAANRQRRERTMAV